MINILSITSLARFFKNSLIFLYDNPRHASTRLLLAFAIAVIVFDFVVKRTEPRISFVFLS